MIRASLAAASLSGAALLASTIPNPLLAQQVREDRGDRPNIVFFLVDDMGWMDSSTYGSQYYETPNMDRLAERSVRFTNAYAANPLCSPTRLSIMFGMYPHRLNIFQAACGLPPRPGGQIDLAETAPPDQEWILPDCRRFVPNDERSLADALGEVGYHTGFIGKWHLGGIPEYWPENYGFDVNIGGANYPGPPSYFSPYRMYKVPDGPHGEYLTDRLTDEAIGLIDRWRHDDDPFFLCLWHYAIHTPIQAKDDVTAKYASKTDPRGEQHNPEMAAMIESMDDSLGRLMDHLDATGLSDETMIIFFSDNGGLERTGRPGTERAHVTSNAPLRRGKATLYEGGIRVPAMVAWPGVTQPGTVSDVPFSSIDFYPTLLAATGAERAPGQLLDGDDLRPVLEGAGEHTREENYWFYPFAPHGGELSGPGAVVRKGPWKLHRYYYPTGANPDLYELYNLDEDIGETTNLADEHPGVVAELEVLLDRHIRQTGSFEPKRNPAYNPRHAEQVAAMERMGFVVGPNGHLAMVPGDGTARLTWDGRDP